MIQFNLLPDVKVAFVKARRTKRIVVGTALIASLSAIAVLVILLTAVQGVQRKIISDQNKKIADYSRQLRDTPDLNKILTIQNQLGALEGLHQHKAASSRLFSLMQQVTPADVTISDQTTDYAANTMTINGAAPALDKVNTFVDTLKFATYTAGGAEDNAGEAGGKAFNSVVLSQFGRSETGTSYSITLSYQPELFAGANNIQLIVPKQVTTRSAVEQPGDIFERATTTGGATTTATGTNTNTAGRN